MKKDKQNNTKADLKSTKFNDKLYWTLAHDLKTPLASLQSLTNLVTDFPDTISPAEFKVLVRKINANIHSINEMVNNILQWSIKQKEEFIFQPDLYNLEEIILKNIYIYKPKAEEKKIKIINEIPNDTTFWGERNLIEIVIRNLLSNALKFTTYGGIIRITSEKRSDALFVTVEDNGVGMAPEKLEKVKNQNSVYTTIGTDQEMGTGVGLNICQDIIQMHEGEFNIKSEAGKGTLITFSLPF